MLDFYASINKRPNRYADPNSVQGLLSVRKLCIVRGGYQQGRRPYVNFLGASYSNEELSQRDDARIALATTKDGHRLGVLRAHTPWHRTPHSLSTRSAINSMVRNRRFHLANGADAVSVFMEFVESHTTGKLPVHPSYLELKRILVEHSEFRSNDDAVALAKARLVDTETESGALPSEVLGQIESAAIAGQSATRNKQSQVPPLNVD
jgi:hypothetical protein